MRVSEARAIGEALTALPTDAITPCLNVGSSTGTFREIDQPHIDALIFKPLVARAVQVIHADIKPDSGVDLVGDVYDREFSDQVRRMKPKLVISSNLLEHLEDPFGFLEICKDVLAPNGYMLLTVPYSYPYHLDPIDTGYRPSPSDLAKLFEGWSVIWSEAVEDTTYWSDLKAMPLAAWPRFLLSAAFKAPYLALTNRTRFLSRYHRTLWLFRRYSSSCILVRKPA